MGERAGSASTSAHRCAAASGQGLPPGLVGAGAVPAVALDAADVVHRRGRDGLDARVDGCGAEREAAAAADADGADAVAVDVREGAEVVDAGAEVLGEDLRGRDVPRRAAALAVVGGVEPDRDEAAAGELLRLHARALLLDAAVRRTDDDRGVGDRVVEVRRLIQVGRDLDAVAARLADRLASDFVGRDEGVSVGLQRHEKEGPFRVGVSSGVIQSTSDGPGQGVSGERCTRRAPLTVSRVG